ncbi:hypothetical protein [Kitasatospora sp. NPDC047058]|uniref:hypothetical protein n=1 Tax=Kitasatospora sp. NPDC047058 TaxID=3155620 RepID=UPI0033FDEAA8
MDASGATALLVAVVGVVGTLASALLTQRRGDAARREERELGERRELAERHAQQRSADLAERRASYTTLNTAARDYLTALNDHAHALRLAPAGADAGETATALEHARAAYRRRYAEAQMVVPDGVLVEVSLANRRLSALYGCLKRITNGTPAQSEDLDAVAAAVDEAWTRLRLLRHTMRRDLGISTPEENRRTPAA